MTNKQIIGVMLLATPFVAITIFMLCTIGLKGMLTVYGMVALTVGLIIMGCRLLGSN